MGLLLLCACAHAPPSASPGEPEQPVGERGALYVACVREASAAGAVTRRGRYLLFTCEGDRARALFEALAVAARSHGTDRFEGARHLRAASHDLRDDHCWEEGPAAGCTLLMPVGAFLDAARDSEPDR